MQLRRLRQDADLRWRSSDARADAPAVSFTDNTRADHAVADALADNSVTDNSITDTVSDSIAYSITHALADSTTVANMRSNELFLIAIKHSRAGGLPA